MSLLPQQQGQEEVPKELQISVIDLCGGKLDIIEHKTFAEDMEPPFSLFENVVHGYALLSCVVFVLDYVHVIFSLPSKLDTHVCGLWYPCLPVVKL